MDGMLVGIIGWRELMHCEINDVSYPNHVKKSKLKEGSFLILGNDITIISSSSVSGFSIKVIWKKN